MAGGLEQDHLESHFKPKPFYDFLENELMLIINKIGAAPSLLLAQINVRLFYLGLGTSHLYLEMLFDLLLPNFSSLNFLRVSP